MKTYTFVVEVKREGSKRWEAIEPITVEAKHTAQAIHVLRTRKFADLLSIPGNEGNEYRCPTFVVLENEPSLSL